jgi:hypothetical protein
MEEGQPCKCAEEGIDTCDLITRLTVALPELTTLLGWRLESKGENAARELLGSMELVQGVAAGRPFVPAKLKIVERRGNVNGQATRYVVPVIDVAVAYNELARQAAGSELAYTPAPRRALGVTVADALEHTTTQRPAKRTSAADIPEQEISFTEAPVPVPDDSVFAAPAQTAAHEEIAALTRSLHTTGRKRGKLTETKAKIEEKRSDLGDAEFIDWLKGQLARTEAIA